MPPTLIQRAMRTIGIASNPASNQRRSIGSTSSSRPINKNSNTFRISSTSSQNVST